MGQEYTWIIFIVVMAAMMWWMSRSSKKARQQMADQREAAIQVGKTVVTNSGFFGTIVDIDGEAVTLQSPAGDETVWLKSAIRSEADIPLGAAPEDEYVEGNVDDEYPSEENDTFDTDNDSNRA